MGNRTFEIAIWKLEMDFRNGNWKWKLECKLAMDFRNGNQEWKLEMEIRNGNWKWVYSEIYLQSLH
jgi:hypothetical protein